MKQSLRLALFTVVVLLIVFFGFIFYWEYTYSPRAPIPASVKTATFHTGDLRPTAYNAIEGATQATRAVPAEKTASTSTRPPLPTATPTLQNAPRQPPQITLLAPGALQNADTFHHAIIFTSSKSSPFNGSYQIKGEFTQDFIIESLWLLKLDTLSAIQLTPKWLSSALYQAGEEPAKFINYGANLPTDALQSLLPPNVCIPPKGWNGDMDVFKPCSRFRFSEDGKLLGYAIPIHSCAGQLYLLNLDTRNLVLSIKDRGHFLTPLPDGRWLNATGHCGGGAIAQYDPTTNRNIALGPEPVEINWNAQHTAFYADVSDEMGNFIALWGYNVETGRVFFSMNGEDEQYSNAPVWAPDGKALIFQYRRGTLSADKKKVSFFTPRYLIRVDVSTRSQSKIDDPTGDLAIADWIGDTLRVRRYPFKAQTFTFDALHYQDIAPPAVNCIIEAKDCSHMTDSMAYNYKTGKFTPWSETGLPAATATFVPHKPAANLEKILYEDPAGAFKVVLGEPWPVADQRERAIWGQGDASLWYVPRGETPIPWIYEGNGFIYLK